VATTSEPRTVVIALGGNAITAEDQSGTYAEMLLNCQRMAKAVSELVDSGWRVVVTHGNGPQVGSLSLQQGAAERTVPAQPLSSLVAMTQGWLGGLIELALRNTGSARMPPVVSVVTHVVVDPSDPGFLTPTKPIGPFYDEEAAHGRADELGWQMVEDSGRGYRRVVASPRPVSMLESDAIATLVRDGFLVIAAGGGGVPVINSHGLLQGVDAVVDKDRAAAILASQLKADALLLVTGVDSVLLDFGKPTQRALNDVGVEEITRHNDDGQFPAGSMGPKVEAAVAYLGQSDGVAVITSAEKMVQALEGARGVGTRIRRTAVKVS
jgi:carbamate kinase